MNTDLRKKLKNDFEIDFFKVVMNNAVFGKTIENVSKQRCKPVTTERRRNYLVSGPNFYTAKI